MSDAIMEKAIWLSGVLHGASVRVGPSSDEFLAMHNVAVELAEEVVALRSIINRYDAALAEVVTAARRQLEGTGRGIEPSERLQEAFAVADQLVSRK